MTQSQLQARSRVSRSYLSRIESGQMTPSLGTLEKISEALGVGLNRFFIPESNGEALLEDPFIQGLRPFLRQLDWEQWQSILKRLQAISDHVSTSGQMRTMPPQPQPAAGQRHGRPPPHAVGNGRPPLAPAFRCSSRSSQRALMRTLGDPRLCVRFSRRNFQAASRLGPIGGGQARRRHLFRRSERSKGLTWCLSQRRLQANARCVPRELACPMRAISVM